MNQAPTIHSSAHAAGTEAQADWLDQIKWDEHGLVPAIAQELGSNQVLMFAWMNRDALQKTLELGRAVYWSRSRQRLWYKGEESGHVQQVHEVRLDCDADVVLLKIEQAGGIACHTGRHSCFFQKFEADAAGGAAPGALRGAWVLQMNSSTSSTDTLTRLGQVIDGRQGGNPEQSYVSRLFHKGDDAILKKIGEEATEVVMAAKDTRHGGDTSKLVGEVADLWFHCLVMLSHYDLTPADVVAELERREGLSGLEEKALRKSREREQNGG